MPMESPVRDTLGKSRVEVVYCAAIGSASQSKAYGFQSTWMRQPEALRRHNGA